MIGLKAVLIIWCIKEDILEKLTIEGHWAYGEYNFISILDFDNSRELEEFKEKLRHLIGDEKFKVYLVKYEAKNGIDLNDISNDFTVKMKHKL
ncbi:hypothetical protein [Thermococcus sibiricus]|uniref:hypothetical protein n=1 Tax=Thermococcus sibiricus TaxID=172049 RepID=UPI00164FAAE3|nr:hypothetical protein [Thermococcus sibiricus]